MPWLFLPLNSVPEPTRLIKAVAFDYVMMGIIVCGLINGLKFKYKNKYLAWLVAWVFITVGFNWYYPLVRGLGYNAGTIEATLHVLLALIATVFVCSDLEGEDFIKIIKAICLSVGLVCAFSILQIIGLDPMAHIAGYKVIPGSHDNRHVAALLDNPDLLGNYLAICFPFLFYLMGGKYVLLILAASCVLFACHSSLSTLAALCGTLVFFALKFKSNKKISAGIVLVGLAAIAAMVLNPSLNKLSSGFTGRVGAWQEMVHRINNPAFGQGLGYVKSLMVAVGNNYWMFAHNDYLEIWCSLGTLGLFLFALVIIHSFRNFNYKQGNALSFSYLASFVAFLIVCFGSFPMESGPLALGGLVSFWALEKL